MPAAYKFGWRRQPEDHRDYRFTAPRRVTAALPTAVDLSANMGPFLDQQDLGSCGPHTAAECIDYDEKIEHVPFEAQTPCRLFIYYCARMLMGTINEDSGVDNRSLLKALHQYGYCDEALWPYFTSQFRERPPQACFDAAQAHQIDSYAAVEQSLNQMKGCLASGFPFIFGFTVFPSLLTDAVAQTGRAPDPGPGESAVGGHDVTICGYDDATRRFKFRNHWRRSDGQPWGDQGYGSISYDYAANPRLAGDFWVINAVPGAPAPKPPAPPAPNLPPIAFAAFTDIRDQLIAKYALTPSSRHNAIYLTDLARDAQGAGISDELIKLILQFAEPIAKQLLKYLLELLSEHSPVPSGEVLQVWNGGQVKYQASMKIIRAET